MSLRNERIAEQVRSELSRLIREEVTDPRISLLTLTRVKVSPDLSTATVFWSPLELDDKAETSEMGQGLESAAGFLRSRLAKALSLRRTPALSFRHDRSIEEGSRTLALIRSLPELAKEPEGEGSATDEEKGKEEGYGQEE
ncbi:MAG: 30S ribosome-binding factor RbfA [Myxococcota bacterium]|nr:30S ribosome-binding factor RbfA [Myxococcota bacterium]